MNVKNPVCFTKTAVVLTVWRERWAKYWETGPSDG